MKIFIRRNMHINAYSVWFYRELPEGIQFVKPFKLEFENEILPECCLYPEASMLIHATEMNQLLQTIPEVLAQEGITRPIGHTEGELKATKESNNFNKTVIETLLSLVHKIAPN